MSPPRELAALAYFTGVWEGHGRFLESGLGPALTQPVVHIEATFVRGGHWLEQRFSWIEQPCDSDDVELAESLRIWGYDGTRQKFVSDWFDSHGRRATVTSSGWQGDRLLTAAVVAVGGQEIRFREAFVCHGLHEWRHVSEQDKGDGWTRIDEQTFQRVWPP